MTDAKPNSSDVYREQVESIFLRLPAILSFELIAAMLVVGFAVLTTSNYHWLAFVWISLVLSISAVRLGLQLLFRNTGKYYENLRLLGNFLFYNSLISGVIWGTTWVIVPIGSIAPPKGATVLWPCAMILGAAVSYAAIRRIFLALAVPALLLQLGNVFYLPGPQGLQIGVGLTAFALFAWILSRVMHRDQIRGIELKISNKQLRADLIRDGERIQEQEQELFARINREQSLLEEKRRTGDELAAANEEKLLLLDAAGEGIFGTDENGRITFVNASALRMLKYKENQVIGQDATALLCRGMAGNGGEEATRLAISNCFHSGEPLDDFNGFFHGAGDLILPVKFSCRPVLKEGEFIGVVVSFFDMTRQLDMESRLVQSQKMEAIGRITGGVAHDFNNLLTVILGNLKFLRRRLEGNGREEEVALVDKICGAAKRGSELNSRLQSFSREQALESNPEYLHGLLRGVRDFLARILGEDIELELELSEEPLVIMIDRAQFESTMLNLCLNARDAMPEGGRVRISTRRMDLADSGLAPVKGVAGGKWAEITVTDTGAGISGELLGKIFDPFFTTKPPGEGSGLGLSTAYGFIRQSGGDISVRSTPGDGTAFILQLPLVDAEPVVKDSVSESAGADTFSGTILVVEDDLGVLEIARKTLLEAGFRVLIADCARAGLEKFYRHPEIDLVFSDIIMPGGTTGIEMASEMLNSRPELRILLATGYTQKLLKDEVADLSNITCIPKPYDIDELPGLIDSLMGKAA